jgi:hypothetical protein
MARALSLAAVLSLALFAAGCKDDHESLMKKNVSKMQEALDVLKGVKDKASADAAATKLKAIGEDVKEIQKKMAALPQPTEAEAKKMLESSESSFKKAWDLGIEIAKEQMRIVTSGLMTPNLESAVSGMGGGRVGGRKGPGMPF